MRGGRFSLIVAAVLGVALHFAPGSTQARPSDVAQACLAQVDFESLFLSMPPGDQLHVESVGPENEDYVAVLVGHGVFVHTGEPPQYFHEPTYVLIERSSCRIAHAFELQPRNEPVSEHFLVFNEPQNQIAIFSKWQGSSVSGPEIRRAQGAVAASYSYDAFSLRTVTRYADEKYFPNNRLIVDADGIFGYFPCWYPEICKISMRDFEFVERFQISDETFDSLGMVSDRSVRVNESGKSARGALGESTQVPDGALIGLAGVDASGQRRYVSFAPNGEPVYAVLRSGQRDSYFATVSQFEEAFGLAVDNFVVNRVDNPDQNWSSETLYDDPDGERGQRKVDDEMLQQIQQIETLPRYKKTPEDSQFGRSSVWVILALVALAAIFLVGYLVRRSDR